MSTGEALAWGAGGSLCPEGLSVGSAGARPGPSLQAPRLEPGFRPPGGQGHGPGCPAPPGHPPRLHLRCLHPQSLRVHFPGAETSAISAGRGDAHSRAPGVKGSLGEFNFSLYRLSANPSVSGPNPHACHGRQRRLAPPRPETFYGTPPVPPSPSAGRHPSLLCPAPSPKA